ncbi:MAG: NAD(P)H-dependent oxidoreductase [Bdellovibrionaceae bacterium]|nr:NAD(P)H-dependent oxidoreductase [Pseudobdellovibrionaceae bacterium]
MAHPYLNRSVANKIICGHVKELAHVTFHDLYETYPYFSIDIKKEQEILRKHDLIVFQHPFYWNNMPPLLKLWQDEVLETGFAYGENGKELAGKEFLLSITTGGSADTYTPEGQNKFPVTDFMRSYEQMCSLCGMKWNPPHVLHSSRQNGHDEIYVHANKLKDLMSTFAERGHL